MFCSDKSICLSRLARLPVLVENAMDALLAKRLTVMNMLGRKRASLLENYFYA